MTLPRDTLELIQKTAVQASKVMEYDISPLEKLLVFPNKETERIYIDPPKRKETFGNLDDLIAAATSLKTKPEIWVAKDQVYLIYSTDERIDIATYPMKPTVQFIWVVNNANKTAPLYYAQREFVNVLKYTIEIEPVHIAPFIKMQWNSGSTTNSALKNGADRLGREIRNEAMSEQGVEIPSDLFIPLYVYDRPTPRTAETIKCGVELNVQEQKIGLLPYASDVERVQAAATNHVYEYIVKAMPEDSKVYRGRPTTN